MPQLEESPSFPISRQKSNTESLKDKASALKNKVGNKVSKVKHHFEIGFCGHLKRSYLMDIARVELTDSEKKWTNKTPQMAKLNISCMEEV